MASEVAQAVGAASEPRCECPQPVKQGQETVHDVGRPLRGISGDAGDRRQFAARASN
jgi:hypothetical protein